MTRVQARGEIPAGPRQRRASLPVTRPVRYHRGALLLAVSGVGKHDTMPQEGIFMFGRLELSRRWSGLLSQPTLKSRKAHLVLQRGLAWPAGVLTQPALTVSQPSSAFPMPLIAKPVERDPDVPLGPRQHGLQQRPDLRHADAYVFSRRPPP